MTAGRAFVVRSLIVVTAAAAVRLFLVFFDPFLAGDSYEYNAIASNLISGHGYGLVASSPTVYRAPVYPLFVAAAYLFGTAPGFVFLIQVFVGALGAWAVYLLGRRVVGERAGVLGAVLAAIDPHLAWYAGTLLAETVTIALLSFTLLGASVVADSGPRRLAVLVGAGFGAVALSSPALAALPAGYVVVLLLRRWTLASVARATVLLIAGYSLVLAPWVVRNEIEFRAFVPLIVPHQGLGLWLAAIRQPLYDYDFVTLAEREPIMARWHDLYIDHRAQEREWLGDRLALQQDMLSDAAARIAREPAAFLEHRLQLLPSLWISPASYASLHSVRPPFQDQNRDFGQMVAEHLWLSAIVRVAITAVFAVGFVGLALLGIWALRRRWRAIALLLLPAAYVAIAHSAIWIEFRYSLPTRPALWLVASAGALWCVGEAARLLRSRRHVTSSP